ncbi:hypothetical protein M9H77_30431 [Catharanthus roseus]|uniref:Uncharacterized protein n=1 Tax=Catharanthus roseus TaxID=4058 RepID=A0ACB9ZXJ9_CATRO|nr:hypothetical protein M9H77_30431 [Catharanthus roseus]
MDSFEDYLHENDVFEGNEDPNMFEEFLESEEYIDHGQLFTTHQIFKLKVELVDWAKETAMKANTYLIINRYLKSRTFDCRPYVTLACERGGAIRKYTKPRVDDEEEVPIKNAQKIYNVVAKIKKNRMQGRNTVEEVLYLSAQRGYTVFYRNAEDSVLRNIVVAHPTSIVMIRTWPYVPIMDTTYKMNKESRLMPVIEDVFSKSYHMLCRRYIDQNVLAKLTEMVKDEEVATRVWTSEVLHFGVETTNRAESKHLVLKLWLSTCHGDLDIVTFGTEAMALNVSW